MKGLTPSVGILPVTSAKISALPKSQSGDWTEAAAGAEGLGCAHGFAKGCGSIGVVSDSETALQRSSPSTFTATQT